MASNGKKPLFSFGLVADVQYADMDDTFVEGRRQRFREVCICHPPSLYVKGLQLYSSARNV